jgi:N-acylneuraminate cytidylyltransferase/CMP-N,N'-diacetyllegionaminic acid synthase
MSDSVASEKILVLIPAKAGSVRLPRKNVRPINGVSLLERTIKRAQALDFVSGICVSTEDDEVAQQAINLGVEVPFMRPEKLARDPAGVVDVALHALDWFSQQRGESYDTLIILLPTSPFCHAQDIRDALGVYRSKQVEFLMSVAKEVHSPLSSLILRDGELSPLHPEWINRTGAKAVEDVPVLVRANGAVTIVNVEAFKREQNYYGYPLAAYEMPWERSIDIDTELDFQFAEFLAGRIDGLLE